MEEREARLGRIVAGVLDEAIRCAQCSGLLVVDDGSPETRLLQRWCQRHLGGRHVSARPGQIQELAGERLLSARATNKTALLLSSSFPGERVLPLGDLYATQIRELAGGCSVPADVQELADVAGGIDALDAALASCFESWLPAGKAAEQLTYPARGPFLEAVRAGRFWRERAGLIPKLSTRTIGIDLFA